MTYRCAVVVAFLLAWPPSLAADGWISNGPFGGYVGDFAIDPADPSTLYAASGGGLFKSTDGGESWRRPLVHPVWDARDVAIDPVNPATLYVTTGDGVLKSTDGGEDWELKNGGLEGASVGYLAIDPLNPSNLLVTVSPSVFIDYNLYKSLDGGESWAEVEHGLLYHEHLRVLTIDPLHPSTWFTATFHEGVLRSSDGGESWSPINNGLTTPIGVYDLAVDPVSSSTLYLAADMAYGSRVYKSIDGGDSWVLLDNSPQYVFALAIDPVTRSTVYAGTDEDGVFKSLDGGENPTPLPWRSIPRIPRFSTPDSPATRSTRASTAAAAGRWFSLRTPWTCEPWRSMLPPSTSRAAAACSRASTAARPGRI